VLAAATNNTRLGSGTIRDYARDVEILGVRIGTDSAWETLGHIHSAAQSGRVTIAYVNAHTLNLATENRAMRRALSGFDFVLNDGIGVSLAARLQGRAFPENLQGSDFNIRILEMAASASWPVFLLGGRPGIPERAAAEMVRAIPGLRIVGTRHGFYHRSELDVQAVSASGAEVLLVAMGNPRQELWIDQHFCRLTQLRIGVGVGAFFDFQAKAVPRAPEWMNRWGIEWVHRLAQEPRRLAKRYVIGNPLFLLRVAHERLSPRAYKEPR
jgi:exopolysaccharide biosynthesis WecB/TagA/CpsF family protein